MDPAYRLVPDQTHAAQFTLELTVALDPPAPLATLSPGDRFVLDGAGLEGKLLAGGSASVSVAVRRDAEGWTKTTWSSATVVRRMRA